MKDAFSKQIFHGNICYIFRQLILTSLSLNSRLIDLAKDICNVREQDYFTLLANISNNRIGEPIVWDFYRNEWNYLVDRFSLNDRLLGRVSFDVS